MLLLSDSFICTKPQNQVKVHKHIMPHIIISESAFDICVDGQDYSNINFAIIDGETFHSVKKCSDNTFMFLVFPFTELFYSINNLLNEKNIIILPKPDFSISFSSAEDCICFLNKCFSENNYTKIDERISFVLEKITDGTFLDKSVEEISNEVNLSKSRLEHLFVEQTQFRLKHILLLFKFKKAYLSVIDGTNITQAAYDSGFSDSAHLAKVAKELTGISIRDFLKNTADF